VNFAVARLHSAVDVSERIFLRHGRDCTPNRPRSS
jgi:hypothetical protein